MKCLLYQLGIWVSHSEYCIPSCCHRYHCLVGYIMYHLCHRVYSSAQTRTASIIYMAFPYLLLYYIIPYQFVFHFAQFYLMDLSFKFRLPAHQQFLLTGISVCEITLKEQIKNKGQVFKETINLKGEEVTSVITSRAVSMNLFRRPVERCDLKNKTQTSSCLDFVCLL